jgi:site-specific DNA-methyltransferase (adenine-specific)
MDDMVRVFNGDCLDFIKELPSEGVALISDVPYGIKLDTRNADNKRSILTEAYDYPPIHGDDKPFDPSSLLRFEYIALFGANNYASKLPDKQGWLVWDKRDGITPNDQSDCELIWTNRDCASRLFRHYWYGMIKASEQNQKRLHPSQKPVAVMKWVIEQLRLPAGTIIADPYMGAGATGVAAMELGYSFWGCEIEKQYFIHAQRRIEQAQSQPALLQV